MTETSDTTEKRRKLPRKLRVIEPTAAKSLRAKGTKVEVVAIAKGYYNHRRIKPGTTFKMIFIGDLEKDLWPEWVRRPEDPEAIEVIEAVLAANAPRNLPPGVSPSRATRPEEIAMRRWKTDETELDEEEDDDDDDDESSSSVASAGGGGGRKGDKVI